jgi:hypothetical protein
MIAEAPHRVLWRRASDGRWMKHESLTGTYRQMLAVHRVLDDARLAGRLPRVDALVVRSTADTDPRWTGAEESGTLGLLFVGRVRGAGSIGAAAKRVGNARGLVAREGGWVYNAKGRALVQGWHRAAERFGWAAKGLIVTFRDPLTAQGWRYAPNDLLTLDADVVLGPQHEPA